MPRGSRVHTLTAALWWECSYLVFGIGAAFLPQGQVLTFNIQTLAGGGLDRRVGADEVLKKGQGVDGKSRDGRVIGPSERQHPLKGMQNLLQAARRFYKLMSRGDGQLLCNFLLISKTDQGGGC